MRAVEAKRPDPNIERFLWVLGDITSKNPKDPKRKPRKPKPKSKSKPRKLSELLEGLGNWITGRGKPLGDL